MIELLAPAGNLEKLKIAILYGADAVYIGGKKFSLRARASNFELEDIKEACDFAHEHRAKVYVTLNIVPHNEDLEGLADYLRTLAAYGVDGIIVTSPHYASVTREVAPQLELHLSTQFSASNSPTIELARSFGFKRVVLAREVSLKQIALIREHTNLDLEVFIHGGMCASYSGRCMLSNHLTNRDANRGGCAHSCRWNYRLYAEGMLQHQEDQFFNMGSKDLMAIQNVPKLIDLGVKSLKIEGRMKSMYYIATVVRCYRMLIDEYQLSGRIADFAYYLEEIGKAENRLTGSGFLEHLPGREEQLFASPAEAAAKEFLGMVLAYDPESQIATVEQRNFFTVNTEVEFFGPHLANTKFIITEMYDEEMRPLEVARHAMEILKIRVPFPLHYPDMFRKVDA